MGQGSNADPIQPLTSVLPGFREKPGGLPIAGVQKIVSVPLVTLTAASTTYKVGVFTAPSDGWYIKDAWFSDVVAPDYATTTLALDNYDKSAVAARNALSTTNQDIDGAATTLKQGLQLTLSATLANLLMDEGDVLNAVVACGATQATAGEGLQLTVVLVGPEID